MMGRSHALSGAAVWVGGAAALAAVGFPPPPTVTIVGAVVCAGAALAPDIDCVDSHAARSFGPLTQTIARGTAAASRAIHARTRTPADWPDRREGHRGVTHSAPFALAVGLVTAAAAFTPAGRWAAALALFITAAWATRAILPYQWRHVTVRPFGVRLRIEWGPWAGMVAATVLLSVLPDPAGWAWLGLPVALGALVHSLGDCPTYGDRSGPESAGVPLCWPIKIRGQRWYRVRPPVWLRFAVGSPTEAALAAGFALFVVWSGWTLTV